MTNTTRKPSASSLLNPTRALADALSSSSFTHPLQVREVLELARQDTAWTEVPARLQKTVNELEDRELLERYLTTRGGRGGYCARVRLSENGRALLARASRAALLVVNGLL